MFQKMFFLAELRMEVSCRKQPHSKNAHARLFFISIFLYILAASAAAAVNGSTTAFISQPPQAGSTTFLEALQDPSVINIVLLTNYTLGDEFDPFNGHPLPITRNVTVTGAAGTFPVLDMLFKRGKVQLCSTCTFIFTHMVVANGRTGVGPAYDFFTGEQGSAVLGQSIYRLRLGCTTAKDSASVVQTTKRSAILPNSTAPQQFTFLDVEYQGRTYHEELHTVDFTTDVPLLYEEGRGPSGGYAVADKNMTRLCQARVTEECLERMSPEACVGNLIHDMQQQLAAATGAAGNSLRTAALAAAIAVPVGAVTVLGLLGIVFWRRRRHRRQQRLQQQQGAATAKGLGDFDDRFAGAGPYDAVAAADGDESPDGEFQAPMGGKRGWELTSTMTTPLLGNVGDSRIQFGDLLGAGSFGRVYKGKWAGRRVAVKVIEHDTTATAAVENEVQMMLSFNHPNIVRAFYYVTYTHTGSSSANKMNSTGSSTAPAGRRHGTDSTLHHDQSPAAAAAAGGGGGGGGGGKTDILHAADTAAATTAAPGAAGGAAPSSSQQQPPPPGSAATASTKASFRLSTSLQQQVDQQPQQQQQQQQQQHDAGFNWTITGGPLRAETWLVQEYCDLGTLNNVATKLRTEVPAAEAQLQLLLLLQDVAEGLIVLHNRSTVHGDLNARNVLVASSPVGPLGMMAKVADLGLSRVIKQHRTHRTTQTVGTMSHQPPELLRYGRMSTAADIYAFAVMMWEIFTGQYAFRDLHYGQFFEAIVLQAMRPPVPADMPGDVLLLLDHCWAADPGDRPTAERLLECLRFMVQCRGGVRGAGSQFNSGSSCIVQAAAGNTVVGDMEGEHEQQQQQQQQQEGAQQLRGGVA